MTYIERSKYQRTSRRAQLVQITLKYKRYICWNGSSSYNQHNRTHLCTITQLLYTLTMVIYRFLGHPAVYKKYILWQDTLLCCLLRIVVFLLWGLCGSLGQLVAAVTSLPTGPGKKLVHNTPTEGASWNSTAEDLGHTNEQSTLKLPMIFWHEV